MFTIFKLQIQNMIDLTKIIKYKFQIVLGLMRQYCIHLIQIMLKQHILQSIIFTKKKLLKFHLKLFNLNYLLTKQVIVINSFLVEQVHSEMHPNYIIKKMELIL